MHLEDLPDLTAFMLQSSFFQCGAFTFRQIQGASMGSALAPVLCTLVASTTEFLWLRNFRSILFNIGLCTAVRYADNRAFHFHEGLRRNSWTTSTQFGVLWTTQSVGIRSWREVSRHHLFCGKRHDHHHSANGHHCVAYIAVRGQSRTCSFRFFSKDSDDHQAHQTDAIDTATGGGFN